MSNVYTDNGYKDRKDYLRQLADEFNCGEDFVFTMADMLGPSEDFDGLVAMLEEM